MQQAENIKMAISGFFAFITSLFGFTGWLAIIWVAAMGFDYISGSISAGKEKKWNSAAAHQGLAKKGGMILFVLGAWMLDLLISFAINNLPGITLPFSYNLPLVCLVLCWYIITEVGSIFENAEKLGAHWPPFLKKAIEGMKASFKKLGGENDEGKEE